jgi:hypothetical protein
LLFLVLKFQQLLKKKRRQAAFLQPGPLDIAQSTGAVTHLSDAQQKKTPILKENNFQCHHGAGQSEV